jgi:hypothetical protein
VSSPDERRFDLAAVRADRWFEQLVAVMPALTRLCASVGDALVALSLAAGVRVGLVRTDRLTGQIQDVTWRRDPRTLDALGTLGQPLPDPEGPDTRGSVGALRSAVLAALVGEVEPRVAPEPIDDPSWLRAAIGPRTALLAPLFGLSLRELRWSESGGGRVVVVHDGIEETVPIRQLRRVLRQRVIEVLQGESGRGQVAIDLAQVELARGDLADGRPEDAVARLFGWLGPLSVYHRTPEGQALDRGMRGRVARGLGALAEGFGRLGRREEQQEALRLSLQYALDGEAAPALYLALGVSFIEEGRHAEAIGPLRRALALGGDEQAVLGPLGTAMVVTGRVVAAFGCARALRAAGRPDPGLELLVQAKLGTARVAYERLLRDDVWLARTEEMPAFPRPGTGGR